jgi:hypothetical protein
MIDHNLAQLNISEDYTGIQIIPSESGNLLLSSTIRQFIIQSRAYRPEVLQQLEMTDDFNLTDIDSDYKHAQPFFHVKLYIKSDDSFSPNCFNDDEEKENFLTYLTQIVGKNTLRNKRGNRAAFIGEFFNYNHPDYGNVLTADLLLGTTIFYNDYRATTNVPANQNELDEILERIYEKLSHEFPNLNIELNPYIFEEETDPFDN